MYTDIIERNLVGDSYVKPLTTLQFPSSKEIMDLTSLCTDL